MKRTDPSHPSSVIDFEHGERAEGERAQKESCLEDSTERSESNPGRSLGIITSSKKNCLEDSTTLIKHQ